MLREFRFAARALGRWRLGTAAAVVTLSVAIGTATALAVFLRADFDTGPDVPAMERVGRIYAVSPALQVERGPVSFTEFGVILAHASAFETVAAYAATGVTLDVTAPADITSAQYVSPEFFPLMRAKAAVGRTFTAADADTAVAIVSERIWRSRLQGRTLQDAVITVDGTARRVVGVLPRAFSYPFIGLDADVWLPLGRGVRDAPAVVSVIGRLRPGAEWPAANAELDALARRGASQWTLGAIPVAPEARHGAYYALAFTIAPAFIVLLIGCVNVAALLMAGGVDRHAELSLRRALGATRGRIARELFAEHAWLAAAGAAGGAAVALALVRILSGAIGTVRPQLAERIADGPAVLAIAAGIAVLGSLLFGVLPAVWLSKRHVAHWLRGLPPPGRVRLAGYNARDLVVFVEIAAASVLVVVAAMWLHFFAELQRVRLGFDASQIVGVRVPDTAADAVSRRIAAIPGVDDVTRTAAPLGGRGSRSIAQASMAGGPIVRAAVVPVGARFVETLGLPIVRGRTLDTAEIRAHAPVAVLSESAAREMFGTANPVGAVVTLSRRDGQARVEVVGICRDAVDYGSLVASGLAQADVYVPYQPLTGEAFLLVRVAGDARRLLRPVAEAAHIDELTRQPQPVVLQEDTQFVRAESAVMIRIFGAFALLALLLAGTGVFAVISHSVAMRTRELGVRLALGDAPLRVLGLVLSRETPLIALAIVLASAFTVAIARVFFPEIVAISARSADTWLWVVALCGGVAAGACALAAARILHLNPVEVLRRG